MPQLQRECDAVAGGKTQDGDVLDEALHDRVIIKGIRGNCDPSSQGFGVPHPWASAATRGLLNSESFLCSVLRLMPRRADALTSTLSHKGSTCASSSRSTLRINWLYRLPS